jgi:5-carboxymethyl-2-hydroxymuconate isomerase
MSGFRVHRTTDGFCMKCTPNANGSPASNDILWFDLGSFRARLCRRHAWQLADEIQAVKS